MSTKKTITALALAGSLFSGHAFAVNITIQDPNRVGETSSGWYKGDDGPGGNASYFNTNATLTRLTSEYEEVEPGMATGKRWDLIAFTADHSVANNQKLGILGTFDLKFGASQSSPVFVGGDIFISVNPTQVQNYVDGFNFGPTSNNNGAPGRYDFALRMNFTTNSYDIYQLSASTVFENTYYDAQNYNAPSNPWKLASVVNNGLTHLGSRSFTYSKSGTTTAQRNAYAATASTLAGFNVTSGSNTGLYSSELLNYVELNNMEWLSPYLNASNPVSYFHYTMECGNDNLIGLDSTGFRRVPDQASTLVLVGLALLGLPAIRSFRRR